MLRGGRRRECAGTGRNATAAAPAAPAEPPTAAEDAKPGTEAMQKPPLGSWMHQTRGGKQQTPRSQVGKDSLR